MMKHAAIIIAAFALVNAQLDKINSGIGDFSIRLLKDTVEEHENTIHSAYSISSALGMCLLGAEGNTYTDMVETLGFEGLSDDEIENGFTTSSQKLSTLATSEDRGFVVSKANRVYVNESFPLGNDFKTKVQQTFNAEFENVNFGANRSAIKDEINAFVSEATHDIIPEVLSEPLDESTVMAVINALYFNGTWTKEFEEIEDSRTFNSHVGSGQPASWLRREQRLHYGVSSDLEATLVNVPYQQNTNSSDQASMLIIFPNENNKNNITDWIKDKFSWELIANEKDLLTEVSVRLTFPKIDVESSIELTDSLKYLGMLSAFTNGANFNKMVETPPAGIKMDKVIHKAKMTTDKFGTTAAAVTIVTLSPTSIISDPPEPEELFVDRSFVALIILTQDDGSVVPLFTSVINKLK